MFLQKHDVTDIFLISNIFNHNIHKNTIMSSNFRIWRGNAVVYYESISSEDGQLGKHQAVLWFSSFLVGVTWIHYWPCVFVWVCVRKQARVHNKLRFMNSPKGSLMILCWYFSNKGLDLIQFILSNIKDIDLCTQEIDLCTQHM